MRTALRGAAFLLTAAMLASGCTGPGRSKAVSHAARSPSRSAAPSPPSRLAVDAERQVGCGRHQKQPHRPLPAGFAAEVAVLCDPVAGKVNGVLRVVLLRQVADHGLAPLVAALRRPSVRPSRGQVCLGTVFFVPLLYLIDRDGDIVRAGIPSGSCGQPQPQFLDALRLVPWVPPTPPSAQP